MASTKFDTRLIHQFAGCPKPLAICYTFQNQTFSIVSPESLAENWRAITGRKVTLRANIQTSHASWKCCYLPEKCNRICLRRLMYISYIVGFKSVGSNFRAQMCMGSYVYVCLFKVFVIKCPLGLSVLKSHTCKQVSDYQILQQFNNRMKRAARRELNLQRFPLTWSRTYVVGILLGEILYLRRWLETLFSWRELGRIEELRTVVVGPVIVGGTASTSLQKLKSVFNYF